MGEYACEADVELLALDLPVYLEPARSTARAYLTKLKNRHGDACVPPYPYLDEGGRGVAAVSLDWPLGGVVLRAGFFGTAGGDRFMARFH